jgi:hypothetical protein
MAEFRAGGWVTIEDSEIERRANLRKSGLAENRLARPDFPPHNRMVIRIAIDVPALPPFEELSWQDAPSLFARAPQLPFIQGWQETPSPKLREGAVRVGWNEAGLWVFATMTDDNIVARATGNNQRLWALGDVFEIFVRDLVGEEYFELHTDPSGFWLQLRFASERDFQLLREGKCTLEELLVEEPLFRTKTRVREGGWDVLACVTAVRGRSLRASFSRYDYSEPEGEPVLSSTSAHREINYHDQPAWIDLRLVE